MAMHRSGFPISPLQKISSQAALCVAIILYINTVFDMDISAKLEILADAAKYDASCASSGAPKRSSVGKAGFGATNGVGICHSYTPDGRCISLLKILLTNFCQYDCQYCVNR